MSLRSSALLSMASSSADPPNTSRTFRSAPFVTSHLTVCDRVGCRCSHGKRLHPCRATEAHLQVAFARREHQRSPAEGARHNLISLWDCVSGVDSGEVVAVITMGQPPHRPSQSTPLMSMPVLRSLCSMPTSPMAAALQKERMRISLDLRLARSMLPSACA
jgi:hypothetical protein